MKTLKQGFTYTVHTVTKISKKYINPVIFYRHFDFKFRQNYIIKTKNDDFSHFVVI